jgi:hypothetical protein
MIYDAGDLKEATGKAQPAQSRPVALFTGQWADLPFEEIGHFQSPQRPGSLRGDHRRSLQEHGQRARLG